MTIERHHLFNEYDFQRLENMWMRLILDAIDELIEADEMCSCPECVLDVAALALNLMPPKYWVSGNYNAFTPPELFLGDEKNRQRAKEAVRKSHEQVKKNPHH